MQKTLFWVLVIVIILAGVAVFYYQQQEAKRPVEIPVSAAPPPVVEEPAEPAIRYPLAEKKERETVDEDQAQPKEVEKPLPPLNNSDAPLRTELSTVIAAQSLDALFNPEEIIRRFVVTVDNLPRAKLPRKYLSTRPVEGHFKVTQKGDDVYLSAENFSRYTPYVELLERMDSDKLVAIYVHFYPLFQQAYENLGYPSAYFNDRVIDVIDLLLETPEIKGPILLSQPHVLYTYADPDLEALSAGQKALLRSGQNNVVRVKAKLRELRASLVSKVEKSATEAGQSSPER